ncbi:MAG: hypothetical protein LBO08_01835 [Rickettsiales bacterium]|jgi:hypothetical protein|nr:hypothetical protein [Rickettsiales bacterium]
MRIFIICLLSFISLNAGAAALNNYVSPTQYNVMQPYLNNSMRTAMKPGGDTDFMQPYGAGFIRTAHIGGAADSRKVVARSAAPAQTGQTTGTARAATQRRVVARSGRGDNSWFASANNGILAAVDDSTAINPNITASQCLSDYTACMEGYCKRDGTLYNRCFCSARLTEIDGAYQPAIQNLLGQINDLRNGGGITREEAEQTWAEIYGEYYADSNHIGDVYQTLDIAWPDADTRTRGQNAFATGHSWCSQNLSNCFSSANLMRDAYRSRIASDCASYEKYLGNVKTAAERIIADYSD